MDILLTIGKLLGILVLLFAVIMIGYAINRKIDRQRKKELDETKLNK